MKIIIREKETTETLSLIDPKSGLDYISDFVGNIGALTDGQFEWDEARDACICDKETFDWWNFFVTENQLMEDRVHELVKEHGSEAVYKVINELGNLELEDLAAGVNQALDEAFGPAE